MKYALQSIISSTQHFFKKISKCRKNKKEMIKLYRMSDRDIQDIGLTRYQLEDLIFKSCWRN